MTETRSNIKWIALLLLLVAVAALSYFISTRNGDDEPGTDQLAKVVLAQNPVPHSTLTIIAQKMGFFREEGLDVSVREFTTGKLCFDAMLAGGADFSTVAETPIMFAGFSRQPLYVIATIEQSSLSVKVLARRDSNVRTPTDLRGKNVGTFKGGSAEYFLSQFLVKNGMAIEDLRVIYMQPPELVAAIIRGDLAAIAMWEPHIYSAQKAIGVDNTVVFTGEDIYTESFNIAVMKQYAESNEATVQAFLRALARAEGFVKTNEEAAKAVVQDAISIDQETLDHIWPNFRFNLTLEQGILDLVTKEAKFAIETGLAPEGSDLPNYRAMFEPKYLRLIAPDKTTID